MVPSWRKLDGVSVVSAANLVVTSEIEVQELPADQIFPTRTDGVDIRSGISGGRPGSSGK